VSTTDWVGAVQALVLAVAAFFAWRTYRLAWDQRLEAAEESRKNEDRRLLQSIVDEVLKLARDAEERIPGAASPRIDLVEGDLQRLRIALAFAPMHLDQTDLLSSLSPGEAESIRRMLDAARIELAEAAERLSGRDPRAGDPSRPAPAMLGKKRTHSGPLQ
jgi:hypothetical protein